MASPHVPCAARVAPSPPRGGQAVLRSSPSVAQFKIVLLKNGGRPFVALRVGPSPLPPPMAEDGGKVRVLMPFSARPALRGWLEMSRGCPPLAPLLHPFGDAWGSLAGKST